MSWRVVFEDRDGALFVVKVPGKAEPGKQRLAVGDAIARFRAMVRACMARPGCGSFVVGVHVDGADCDHG